MSIRVITISLICIVIIAGCAKTKDRIVHGKVVYKETAEPAAGKELSVVFVDGPPGINKKRMTYNYPFTTDGAGGFSRSDRG